MKFRIATVLLSALLVVACGKGGTDAGNGTIAVPPSTPVAGAKPPAGQNWLDMVVKTPDGGYRMGNPDAPVKLVEYGSRTCPHCAAFDRDGFPVLRNGPIAAGKLSYEFRDFPVHAQLDFGPILLGQCVEPAQFFPMLEHMMAAQEKLLANANNISPADQARLQNASPSTVATFLAEHNGYVDFVKQRGVPDAKARACLADPKAIEAIATGSDKATRDYQVNGTPTFIVNGTVATGVAEWKELQPVLKTAGAL